MINNIYNKTIIIIMIIICFIFLNFNLFNSTVSGENFDNSTLPMNEDVMSIEFHKNDVWIGTCYGVLKYNKDTNKIKSYYDLESLNDEVFSIEVDNNIIWFLVYRKGVTQYSISQNKWKNFDFEGYWFCVKCMVIDNDDIWFGTENEILKYSKNSQKWTEHYYSSAYVRWVEDIELDGNNVWFATGDGLYKYSKDLDTMDSFFVDEWIVSVEVDGDNVWIGDDHGYVKRYSKQNDNWETIETGLESESQGNYNLVRSILIYNNDVWIGTECGLVKYSKYNGNVEIYTINDGLISNNINVLEVNDGILWIGTDRGISKLRLDSGSGSNEIKNNNQNLMFFIIIPTLCGLIILGVFLRTKMRRKALNIQYQQYPSYSEQLYPSSAQHPQDQYPNPLQNQYNQNKCSYCNNNLSYINEYQRWYCYTCQRYQ